MRSLPDRKSSGTGSATGTALFGHERLRVICGCALFRLRKVLRRRKNHLFFGSEAGGKAAAVFYSMLATCRANDINPYDYLSDVLGRINDHPINRIEELAPYNWKPSGVAGSASSVALTSSLPAAGSATWH